MSHVSTSFSDTEKEVKVTQSCQTVCDPVDCSLTGFSVHGDSPGKNTGVGCHALFQVIFPTQGLNPGLLHCRRFFTAEPPGKPIVFLLQLIDTSVPSDTSCTLVCSQPGHPLSASLLLGIIPSVKFQLKTFRFYHLCLFCTVNLVAHAVCPTAPFSDALELLVSLLWILSLHQGYRQHESNDHGHSYTVPNAYLKYLGPD